MAKAKAQAKPSAKARSWGIFKANARTAEGRVLNARRVRGAKGLKLGRKG